MEVELGLAPLDFTKIVFVDFGCVLSANNKEAYFVHFLMKKAEF